MIFIDLKTILDLPYANSVLQKAKIREMERFSKVA